MMWRPPVRIIPVGGNEDLPDTREGLFFRAKLALHVEQYEHSIKYMKRLIGILPPTETLTDAERRCFSHSCKLFYIGLRNSWLSVQRFTFDLSIAYNPQRATITANFQDLIAKEIVQFCSGIVEIIDRRILPSGWGLPAAAATAESRVFYMRMKGEYLSNQAEVMRGTEREIVVDAAQFAYRCAKADAMSLPVTHRTRLELDLSFALFAADICHLYSDAFNIASQAIELVKQACEIRGVEAPADAGSVLKQLQGIKSAWLGRKWTF